jgi:uridine kinase
MIGIAGPSGSGKSSLASALAGRLPRGAAQRLPLDAYYRDLSQLEPALRRTRNFDHPRAPDHALLIDQLRTLARGGSVEMPVYHFASHTRAPGGRTVAPGGLVIVEGLFTLYWPELRAVLDLKLFIEAHDALCLARRVARDVAERGRAAEQVREQYETTVRPMHERYIRPTRRFADAVLDGTRPVDGLLEQVLPLVSAVPFR